MTKRVGVLFSLICQKEQSVISIYEVDSEHVQTQSIDLSLLLTGSKQPVDVFTVDSVLDYKYIMLSYNLDILHFLNITPWIAYKSSDNVFCVI